MSFLFRIFVCVLLYISNDKCIVINRICNLYDYWTDVLLFIWINRFVLYRNTVDSGFMDSCHVDSFQTYLEPLLNYWLCVTFECVVGMVGPEKKIKRWRRVSWSYSSRSNILKTRIIDYVRWLCKFNYAHISWITWNY